MIRSKSSLRRYGDGYRFTCTTSNNFFNFVYKSHYSMLQPTLNISFSFFSTAQRSRDRRQLLRCMQKKIIIFVPKNVLKVTHYDPIALNQLQRVSGAL